jgi:hypothetical protein
MAASPHIKGRREGKGYATKGVGRGDDGEVQIQLGPIHMSQIDNRPLTDMAADVQGHPISDAEP